MYIKKGSLIKEELFENIKLQESFSLTLDTWTTIN